MRVCGGGGGGAENIFSYQRISQRVVRTSLEKQLDPRDPIASRWGSVPVFVRKHIATCDFPGVSGALPPPGPATGYSYKHHLKLLLLLLFIVRRSIQYCYTEFCKYLKNTEFIP